MEKRYNNPVALVERNGEIIKYYSGIQARADVQSLGGRILSDNETPGKTLGGYIVEPGDKVVVMQHMKGGARFHIRATVKKVNKTTVVVEMRFKGKVTGQIMTEDRTVSTKYVYREEWEEALPN